MRKWVKVRFGLTFQDPESIIKYVKTLGKQDPQNRQAALVLLLAWLDDRLHQILAYYSTGDDASEDTVSELENSIIYLADGWRKGVLDISEKSLPAAEGQATTPAPSPQAIPAVAQAAKRLKTTYGQQKQKVAYKDLKRKAMMAEMKL